MIEEIFIHDLGVINEARLPLGPGFTALTGESGAGKTMVVTALGLLLGERADSAAIRSGSDSASVEGRWRIAPDGTVAERVRDAGGELEGGELILSRSVLAEGRSRTVVGGRSAPVGVLNEIGQQLVVVHGQSDQVRLRSATAQREALDRFGGAELIRLRSDYVAAFTRWHTNQGELDVLIVERDRRSLEAHELRLAIEEIERLAPRRGEDDELSVRAARLANLEDLRFAAAQAHDLISSEGPDDRDVLGLLSEARRHLDRVRDHDTALAEILQSLVAASFSLSEVSTELASYLGSLDADGARELETIQGRRADLAGLMRRYGPTIDDVIDHLDSGSARLLELDNDSTRSDALREQVEADRREVACLAAELTELRAAAAAELSERVTAELGALAMPDAAVTITVTDRSDYSQSGKDQVSFLLRPHPGSEPRPLGRGASGGELSRVMLAIEVVIADSDPVPTFVFDEIDAGIGGASAIEVGRRLARLGRSAQVIAVTHLAQVAAFATNHLRVSKGTDGAVTASSVQQLQGQQRVSEMARLLSGLGDSESALAHARDLIATAHELREAL